MIVESRRELILGEIEPCGIAWNVGMFGWWKNERDLLLLRQLAKLEMV